MHFTGVHPFGSLERWIISTVPVLFKDQSSSSAASRQYFASGLLTASF